MHPVYNLSACALVVASLGCHLWLASRIHGQKGRGFGVAALLIPCFGLIWGLAHLKTMRAPALSMLACVLAFFALGKAAGDERTERARQRAAARDGGVDDDLDSLGFGD
ncbi:MAG: hypothetical protein IT380_17040 [Myxococcales bacterium]|nr:hypothetical protein [Myxococcales bacterium]